MYNVKEEALNKTYRKEQEARAAKAQLAQSIADDELNILVRYARNTNIGSSAIFILAIVILVIFFGLSTTSASAQNDSFEPGEGGGATIEMLYLRGAVSNVQAGDYETAITLFDEINTHYPEFAAAYTGRAYVSLMEGNYEIALEEAMMAFELDPADGAIYYVLAEIHFAIESYADASFYYEAYQLWVETSEREPILIVLMVGEDSLELVSKHLVIANASEEEIV